MAKEYFVFSTLSAGVTYTHYEKSGGDLPIPTKRIPIKGGAGIADKNLITPLGVMTRVTEEEMGYLLKNDLFTLHQKNGFITVRESPQDVEKVVAEDMKTRDKSAPIVPEDFKEDDKAKPMTGKSKKG